MDQAYLQVMFTFTDCAVYMSNLFPKQRKSDK